jgi:hypothetical protein
MTQTKLNLVLMVGAGAILLGSGCSGERDDVGIVNRDLPQIPLAQNLPVGASCVPGDLWDPEFSNFGAEEVNVEVHSSQCASGVCLVHHFQGRPDCPYGQAAPEDPNQFESPPCALPDGRARVATAVKPQLVDRRPEDAILCSCHCAGPEGTGPFCQCPSGFECAPVIDFTFGEFDELAGSYCIKAGTIYTGATSESCDWETQSCGPG